jgi:ABC-type glycerol-3-phosphate transport system permease component
LIVVSVFLALPVGFLAVFFKAAAATAVSKTSQKVHLVVCCFLHATHVIPIDSHSFYLLFFV